MKTFHKVGRVDIVSHYEILKQTKDLPENERPLKHEEETQSTGLISTYLLT